MSIPASLQTLLLQFQNRYPLGGVCAELLTIHQNHYVVRALVQVGNITIASAMAAAADLEAAEERAKVRALECLGLAAVLSSPSPTLHVPSLNIPEAALNAAGQSSGSPPMPNPTPRPQPGPTAWPNQLPATREPAEMPSSQATGPETVEPTEALSLQPTPPLPPNILGGYSDRADAIASILPTPEIEQVEQPAPALGATQLSDLPVSISTATPAATVTVEPEAASSSSRIKPEKAAKRKAEPAVEPAIAAATVDRSQEVMRIGIEMKRLGWSTEQGREYLKRTYGKRSRQELDDAELLDFLHFLESQPSTLQAPF